MPDPTVQALGWKRKLRIAMEFFRCPNCGRLSEALISWTDGNPRCYGCGRDIVREEWKSAKRFRYVAVCRGCSKRVPLTEMNFGMCSGCHYICSACGNIVAALYGNGFVNPSQTYLKF